jgi:hypothetical protein
MAQMRDATICLANLGSGAGVVQAAPADVNQLKPVGISLMVLLMAFIVSVLVGDVIAVGIAEVVELFSEKISLFVFLALYVGVIPVAWRIAVRFTEPKTDAVTTRAP